VQARRFDQLTYSSFLGAFALNAIFMVSGFLLFGGASKAIPRPPPPPPLS
jgi:hypothetical protein